MIYNPSVVLDCCLVLRSSAVVLETGFDKPTQAAGRKGACSVSSPGGYRTLSERHYVRTAAQPGLPPPQGCFLTEKEEGK